MNDYYCLDLDFSDVNFSPYDYSYAQDEINKVFHAHLYTRQDEIELKIFFEEKTHFDNILMNWLSGTNKKFGSLLKIEVTKNNKNERLQKVDLSDSQPLWITSGTNYYEKGNKYIIVKIDSVKCYWKPIEDKNFTADFYLDDKGFRIVEPFYGRLYPKDFVKNDGEFEIARMTDTTTFYKLEKSIFRPEYHFFAKDKTGDRVASITKEPKIHFKYQNDITEKEAIFYGDVVLMLASFYHHIKIDYIVRSIHLPEHTITIKNIEQKNFLDKSGNLWAFGIEGEFKDFLELTWQKDTVTNYKLLSKAIGLFNQSHLVDSYSRFLIRYNIIEICDKQKPNKAKFKITLNKSQRKEKQKEALEKLLETIDNSEHAEFKKRWNNVQTLLQNKPMKNQLVSFLESQNLNPKDFPIKIDALKELRDNITHGSIDKVDAEELKRANILLYRIDGILILNLMGIKDWTFNTKLT